MRLTPYQINIIKQQVYRTFGDKATVMLFGSRTDDIARGGDIDLLVQLDRAQDDPQQSTLHHKALLAGVRIQRLLGEQKIDIVTLHQGQAKQPIHQEALRTGVVL